MKALFVFAHPDDESFAAGGTIASFVKKGFSVMLVTATRGEAGQLGDPPVCTQQELPKVREQELRAAAKILGISRIYFLDFIDGTLHKDSLPALKSKVQKVLRQEKPDIVVTFDKGGITNHPDHIAVSRATTSAFKEYMNTSSKRAQLYHTVLPQSYADKLKKEGLDNVTFGDLRATPDEAITLTINVSDFYSKKVEAFRCHRSQNRDFEKFLKWGKYIDHKHEHLCLVAESKKRLTR